MKKSLLLLMMIMISSLVEAQMDSMIYGMTSVSSGKYFSKVDPITGTVTFISNLIPNTSGFTGRTVDPRTKMYYSLQDSILLKINLLNGQLTTVPIINISNMQFVGITYNCYDTTLYGLSISRTGPSINFARINGNTGLVENISDSIAPSYRIYTSTTIDPDNHIFYFETTTNLLIGIDIYSGIVVSSVAINLPSDSFFGPLVYNCHDYNIYGLSGNSVIGRKLAKIDPATGNVTIISENVVAQSIIVNPSTIDPYKSLYYFIAGDGTFRGVRLDDGKLEINTPLALPFPDPDSYFANFVFNHECFYDYTVGINSKTSERISIFPNPASDKVIIRIENEATVMITDFLGQKIYEINLMGTNTIDTKELSDGIYFISVITNKSSILKKLIINHKP